MRARRSLRWVAVLLLATAPACTNNPYPDADDALKVRYRTLPGPPKTLDPAVTYSNLEHQITANVYETLLEYHYLKRPYELMPGFATAVPERQARKPRAPRSATRSPGPVWGGSWKCQVIHASQARSEALGL